MSLPWFKVEGGQIKPSFSILQSLVSSYININNLIPYTSAEILTTSVLSTAGMLKVYN